MENYHLTKDEQFNQEERQLTNAMDREAENKPKPKGNLMASIKLEELLKLREDNKILISALKEIAVSYPETNNTDQDKLLCNYLIAKAKETIHKIEPENNSNVPPVFQEIINDFLKRYENNYL